MNEIWIIYEQEIIEGVVHKRLVGSYETEEEARVVYTAILLDKPEDVEMEIVIEKKINTDFSEDLVFNVLFLEMQLDKLSNLINTQATLLTDFQKRIKNLEKTIN